MNNSEKTRESSPDEVFGDIDLKPDTLSESLKSFFAAEKVKMSASEGAKYPDIFPECADREAILYSDRFQKQKYEIGERLREILEHLETLGYKRVKGREFAAYLKFTQRAFSNIARGTQNISIDILTLLSLVGANTNWILTGRGHPLMSDYGDLGEDNSARDFRKVTNYDDAGQTTSVQFLNNKELKSWADSVKIIN